MAKGKAGLPEGFDLKVSSVELVSGPARLPGYLDRGTSLSSLMQPVEDLFQRQEVEKLEEEKQEEVLIQKVVEQPRAEIVNFQQPVSKEPQLKEAPIKKEWRRPQRLQINISTDAQIKVNELVEQLVEQSPEKGVNYNDVIQALILSLYDAKGEIDVSRLPLRGRWGSPTAKSFAAALAEVFREALVQHKERSSNPIRKAVGA